MCCCRKVNRKFEGGKNGYLFERSLPRASRKDFLTMARGKIASAAQLPTSESAAAPPGVTSPPTVQNNNNNNNPNDPTTRSLKLLCVRNLAKNTDASDLLHFLNQMMNGAGKNLSRATGLSNPPPPLDIQNILVHNGVAILSCCTSQFVDSILQRLQAGTLGPIIYRGQTLEIGRPKCFMTKRDGESHVTRRHDRSILGMVVVVTKQLARK